MQPNPFEPPSDAADVVARESSVDGRGLRVYTPNHAALAAFIGSPIAGAWIIAANYATFGKSADRWRALVLGLVATIGVFTLAFALPEGTPNSLIPIVYTLALRELAKRLQGPDVDRVLSTGGTAYSGWRAAGVATLWLVAVCAVLFGGLLYLFDEPPLP